MLRFVGPALETNVSCRACGDRLPIGWLCGKCGLCEDDCTCKVFAPEVSC
jgi:hypothetical protein